MRKGLERIGMVAAVTIAIGWSAVSLSAAHTDHEASPPASPSASPMASPAASPAAIVDGELQLSIFDYGFAPIQVEVPVGTTVTWTNDGQVIHTTTSKDGLWDSAIMEHGDIFSYTFDTPGTYEYWCTLHPAMLGTIVVTDG